MKICEGYSEHCFNSNDSKGQDIADRILDDVVELPTADVEEVKHGYWKDRYGNKYANHLYECSICGKEALFEFYLNELDQTKERQVLTPICPYCGAKMDGGNAE